MGLINEEVLLETASTPLDKMPINYTGTPTGRSRLALCDHPIPRTAYSLLVHSYVEQRKYSDCGGGFVFNLFLDNIHQDDRAFRTSSSHTSDVTFSWVEGNDKLMLTFRPRFDDRRGNGSSTRCHHHQDYSHRYH